MVPLWPLAATLAATLVLTLAPASDALCVANCNKDEEQRAHNEYVVCQAQAQGKLRNGTLDICDYFDTSVNVCAEVLSRCQCDDNLRSALLRLIAQPQAPNKIIAFDVRYN